MTLGPLIVLTDRHQAEAVGRPLVDAVDAALDGGARTVLLREKDLPSGERVRLADQLAARLREADGRLLVAGDAALARAMGAAGVHLAAADAWPPITSVGNGRLLVGRSGHDLDELQAAHGEGVDYVTFSPIWETASKPGYGPAVGLDGLRAAAAAVPALPVYALGGIGPGRAAPCVDAGAAGVAVMGEVMRADDPAAVVRALLAELPPG